MLSAPTPPSPDLLVIGRHQNIVNKLKKLGFSDCGNGICDAFGKYGILMHLSGRGEEYRDVLHEMIDMDEESFVLLADRLLKAFDAGKSFDQFEELFHARIVEILKSFHFYARLEESRANGFDRFQLYLERQESNVLVKPPASHIFPNTVTQKYQFPKIQKNTVCFEYQTLVNYFKSFLELPALNQIDSPRVIGFEFGCGDHTVAVCYGLEIETREGEGKNDKVKLKKFTLLDPDHAIRKTTDPAKLAVRIFKSFRMNRDNHIPLSVSIYCHQLEEQKTRELIEIWMKESVWKTILEPSIAQVPAALSLLQLAVTEGDVQTINHILEQYGETKILILDALFCLAVRFNQIKSVQLLLEKNVNLDFTSEKHDDGSALHIAVANNNLKMVKLLLNHGANPNAQDKFGRSPLHHAMEKGHKKIAFCLMEYGANLFLPDNKRVTPFGIQLETPLVLDKQETKYFSFLREVNKHYFYLIFLLEKKGLNGLNYFNKIHLKLVAMHSIVFSGESTEAKKQAFNAYKQILPKNTESRHLSFWESQETVLARIHRLNDAVSCYLNGLSARDEIKLRTFTAK